MTAFQQFVIDERARYNDLRPFGANPLNFSPLPYWQASQEFGDAGHLRTRNRGSLSAACVLAQTAGGCRQCRRRARRRNDIFNPGGCDPMRDPVHFARDKAAQTLEFALARRVVAEKFVGEPHRAQGQTDGVTEVAEARDRTLTTAASQVDP